MGGLEDGEAERFVAGQGGEDGSFGVGAAHGFGSEGAEEVEVGEVGLGAVGAGERAGGVDGGVEVWGGLV